MKRNRPYDSDTDRELFDDNFHAASMSDCTGLIPTAPIDESEIRSYSDIFDIPLPNYRSDRRNIMNDQNRNQNNSNNQNNNSKNNQNSNSRNNQNNNSKNNQNSNSNKKDDQNNRYDNKSFN